MAVGAAARQFLPLIALGLIPVLLHLVIVESSQWPLVLATGFGRYLKLGLVTTSALMHWAIYSGLLVTFGRTLLPGTEPLISAMTRRLHGALSQEVTAYTRKVTVAWCIFFTAQLVTSIALFACAPLVVWSFFVNILDLPLVATMFAAEYVVRVRSLSDPPRETLAAILTMITNARKPHEEAAGSL